MDVRKVGVLLERGAEKMVGRLLQQKADWEVERDRRRVLLGTGSLEVVSQPSVQQELLQTLVLVRSVLCLLLCRTPRSPVLMLRVSQLGQHIARSLVLSQQQLSLVVDERWRTAHVAEQLDLVDTVQAQAALQLADWLATQPFSRASEQTVQAQCVLMGEQLQGLLAQCPLEPPLLPGEPTLSLLLERHLQGRVRTEAERCLLQHSLLTPLSADAAVC
jgi:hypothetical protein